MKKTALTCGIMCLFIKPICFCSDYLDGLKNLNEKTKKISASADKVLNSKPNITADKYFGRKKINTKEGKTRAFAIQIPYAVINERINDALGRKSKVKVANSKNPVIEPKQVTVVSKSKKTKKKEYFLDISNLSVNIPGFKYKPNARVRPYYAAKNTIGLKIIKLNQGKSGGGVLDLAKKMGLSTGAVTDKLSGLIVSELGRGIADILAKEISAKKVSPSKIVKLSYSAKRNTVYAKFADEFVSSFMGKGYALSGFKFTDKSFVASFGSKNTTPLLCANPYTFAVGDGNVNGFLRSIKGNDVDFQKTAGYPTGVIFDGGASARFTLSAKVPLPYKLKGKRIKAAFSARVRPGIKDSKTLFLNIENMNLNRIYAGSKTLPNLPGFIQNMPFVQSFIIGRVTDAIIKADGLKEYIVLKKTSAKRVEFQSKNGSFLPIFASIFKLIGFSADNGVLFMKYKGK